MQTFLPYPDFKKSFKVLDYKRLGKQRVEAYQVLNILRGRQKTKGFVNHPITKMWRGYENGLRHYLNLCIEEWMERGYNNTMEFEPIEGDLIMPHWLGNKNFHSSHRANLLRKDYNYYSQFGWKENSEHPYHWYDMDKKQWYKHIVESGNRVYYK
mgnify:CR=1 FL=1